MAVNGGYFAFRVKAYDSTCIEKGTIFEIPITVVQPTVLEAAQHFEYSSPSIACKPNTIIRDFFQVPKNASWAAVELISDNPRDFIGGRFYIHTQQIVPARYCKAHESLKLLNVNCENYVAHTFKVVGENILEVCLAKYWSNFGDMAIRYRLRFHGVSANNSEALVMHSSSGVHRIDLTGLTTEEILPAISLKTAVMVLRPVEAKISALTSRDVLPAERQIYQNVLTYNFHMAKAQEVALAAPLLYSVLYESQFESQLWMIFDANKQLLGTGDAYSNCTYIKLEKGDYTVKLQVRHEKQDYLEKVSEATMLVYFKLSSALSLDVYKSFNQAIIAGKKITASQILNGAHRPLYITSINNEKLTKAALPAQVSWLEGTIVFARDEAARKVDTLPFQYILTEGPPVKKANGSNGATKETKSKAEEYKEGLRDFQVAQIAKLDSATAEEVYNAVLEDHPTHLPVHMALIAHLESGTEKQLPLTFKQNLLKLGELEIKQLEEKIGKISELASLVIDGTDQDGLLKFYGLKTDNRPDAAKIKT